MRQTEREKERADKDYGDDDHHHYCARALASDTL